MEYIISGENRFRTTNSSIHKLIMVVPVEEQDMEEEKEGRRGKHEVKAAKGVSPQEKTL